MAQTPWNVKITMDNVTAKMAYMEGNVLYLVQVDILLLFQNRIGVTGNFLSIN